MRAAVLLIVIGIQLAAAAQGTPSAALKDKAWPRIEKGDRLRDLGQTERAVDEFKDAKNNAEVPWVRAEAALKAGQSQLSVGRKTNDQKALQDAFENFRFAKELGSPEQKAQASNNMAVFHLSNANPKLAVDELRNLQVDRIAKDHRFAVHFNYARALEQTGDVPAAVEQASTAFRLNPQFLRAADLAWDSMLRSNDRRLLASKGYPLCLEMLEHGYTARVRDMAMSGVLKSGFARSDLELFLALLLHSHIRMGQIVDVQAGEARVHPQLMAEIQAVAVERLEPGAVRDLNTSVAGRFRLGRVEPQDLFNQLRDQFPWASNPERRDELREAFGLFLRHAGDYYVNVGMFASAGDGEAARQPDPEQALTRYLLAWTLDANNLEAAQNAAWVLATYQGQNPQQANHYYAGLQAIIDRLFRTKGELYAERNKSKEDWEYLLRMHLLLGTMFEQQQIWGDEGDVRSAIFQWNAALLVERRIREMDPNSNFRAAGLHLRAARSYQAVERIGQAFDHYLTAAEAFVQRGEMGGASFAMQSASRLRIDRTAEQERRWAALIQAMQ